MSHPTMTDNIAAYSNCLRRLAESVFTLKGSDAKARALVREVEAVHPGFISRLAAVNDLQRLGIATDASSPR